MDHECVEMYTWTDVTAVTRLPKALSLLCSLSPHTVLPYPIVQHQFAEPFMPDLMNSSQIDLVIEWFMHVPVPYPG